MTPQIAERLLQESEAALRLVDTLLAELEEESPCDVKSAAPCARDTAEVIPISSVLSELSLLQDDLAEQRALIEHPSAGKPSQTALTAARALQSAGERIDTLARRIQLQSRQQS